MMEKNHTEVMMESEAITLELESSSYKSQTRASQLEEAESLKSASVEIPAETVEVVTTQPGPTVELETSNDLESLKFETTDLEPLKLDNVKNYSETNFNTELVSQEVEVESGEIVLETHSETNTNIELVSQEMESNNMVLETHSDTSVNSVTVSQEIESNNMVLGTHSETSASSTRLSQEVESNEMILETHSEPNVTNETVIQEMESNGMVMNTHSKTVNIPSVSQKIIPNSMVEKSADISKKRALEEDLEPVLTRISSDEISCGPNVIKINKNQFKIGRKPENDAVILSVFISRFHCVLTYDKDNRKWNVTNLSSTDTLLNGEFMQKNEIREIKEGDILQLSASDCFKYEMNYIEKELHVSKQPKLESNDNELNNVLTNQKSFVESQESKRKDLEKELMEKQQEQEELKEKLEKLLKEQNDSKSCQKELNNQILELQKKIETNNSSEKELHQKYKELLNKLEEEKNKYEQKIAEEKLKWQEALRETKQEKERLEMTMVEQMEEYRVNLEQKKDAELQKRIDDVLQEEKNLQTKLEGEKMLLEQKVKEMEEALKQKEAQRQQQEAAAAAAALKQKEIQRQQQEAAAAAAAAAAARAASIVGGVAKVTPLPRAPGDMKKCIILKIGNTKHVKEYPVLETIDLTGGSDGSSTTKKNVQNNAVIDKVNHIMDEQLTCSICSELFVRAMTLNCTHTFCRHCIESWIKRRKECPICRAVIISMTRSLAIDNFIEQMLQNLTPQQMFKRNQLIEERKNLLTSMDKKKIIKKK